MSQWEHTAMHFPRRWTAKFSCCSRIPLLFIFGVGLLVFLVFILFVNFSTSSGGKNVDQRKNVMDLHTYVIQTPAANQPTAFYFTQEPFSQNAQAQETRQHLQNHSANVRTLQTLRVRSARLHRIGKKQKNRPYKPTCYNKRVFELNST